MAGRYVPPSSCRASLTPHIRIQPQDRTGPVPGYAADISNEGQKVQLGAIVAERTFEAFRADGRNVLMTVRFGTPFREPAHGDYRCPVQVAGVGDERVLTAWGKDPFVALQYAIDLLRLILDRPVSGKQLEIRHHRANPERPSWIWKYPPHQPNEPFVHECCTRKISVKKTLFFQ